jgi:3-carboxymuconate cyclase
LPGSSDLEQKIKTLSSFKDQNPLYSGMRKNTLLVFLVTFYFVSCAQKNENYLLIGTYTTGKSEGVYVYHFNSTTGDFDSVGMAKLLTPPISPFHRMKNLYMR